MDSVEDIMNRFGFSESKVKSILFRSRKSLYEFLRKEGYEA
jgi:RNA polymerase sigma-70 factor (ECF subfamily)